jgi:hypothetical protein
MSDLLRNIWKWLTYWLAWEPHFIIGSPDNPYMHRWYLIPRNPWCGVYLHKFLRDDDDGALHDHPWPSLSLVVKGAYIEQTNEGRRLYRAGSLIRRSATYTHRVELVDGKPCWTLFITGPRCREWGFHCPQGWIHWKAFTAAGQPGQIGKGCDQ